MLPLALITLKLVKAPKNLILIVVIVLVMVQVMRECKITAVALMQEEVMKLLSLSMKQRKWEIVYMSYIQAKANKYKHNNLKKCFSQKFQLH